MKPVGILFAKAYRAGTFGYGLYRSEDPGFFNFRADSEMATEKARLRQRALLAPDVAYFHVVAREHPDGAFLYRGIYSRVLAYSALDGSLGLLLRFQPVDMGFIKPGSELDRPLSTYLAPYLDIHDDRLSMAKHIFIQRMYKHYRNSQLYVQSPLPSYDIFIWNPATRSIATSSLFRSLLLDQTYYGLPEEKRVITGKPAVPIVDELGMITFRMQLAPPNAAQQFLPTP